MQMIRLEMRKVMIQQRALLWIVLFLAFKIISMWYGFEAEGIDAAYTETYDHYLEKLGGSLDEEKGEYIVSRYADLQGVARTVNDLEDAYEQGDISKEEYQEKLSAVAQLKQEQEVIKHFYQKYQYAAEDPEKRYIVNENGWGELLAEEKFDFLLVLLLLLIFVPVFCLEYETDMSQLQLCSRKGRMQLTVFKIVMVGMLAAGISPMFSSIEFLFYQYTDGLLYENAPVQSLVFFEESTYKMSLIQLWRLIVFSKMTGAVFLCLMIMAVSVLVRKSLLVIIINGLLILIPIAFSTMQKIKYMLPLPVGLLYGTGYFFPSLYGYQFEPELGMVEKYISFQAFSNPDLYRLAVIYLIVMVILVCVIIGKHLGVRFRIQKRVVAMIMLICILTGLSGCSKSTVEDEVFYKNAYTDFSMITDQYYCYIDNYNIVCQDLQSGASFYLLRDVFERQATDDSFRVSFVASNQYVYYLKDYENRLEIYRVNWNDFSEECIYDTTYDLEDTIHMYRLVQVSKDYFFIEDSGGSGYWYINRQDGTWNVIGDVGYMTLGEYGNCVYYENANSRIVEYYMDTGEQTEYPEISLRSSYSMKSSYHYICDGYCYYTNMLEDDFIYRYCFATGENKRIMSESGVTDFWVLNQNFYYKQNERLCCVNLETMEQTIVLEYADGEIKKSVDGSNLYISTEYDGVVYWNEVNF